MSAVARLTRLERDGCGWVIKFACDDRAVFWETVDGIKARVPWNGREWIPDEKAWWIDNSYLPLIAALFGNYTAMRQRSANTPSAFDSTAIPDKVRLAFAVIHLLPDAPPEVVKAAYRACAALHHPDRGGDTGLMKQINLGYELAYQWAVQHRK